MLIIKSPKRKIVYKTDNLNSDQIKGINLKSDQIANKINNTSKFKKKDLLRGKKLKELFEEDHYFQDLERNVNISKEYKDEYVQFHKIQTEALLHTKHDLNTTIQALASFISMLSAIANYEMSKIDEEGENSYQSSLSQYICFFFTLILMITIIFDNYLKAEIHGINRNIKGRLIRQRLNNIIILIFEMALFFLHPNPIFVDETFDIVLARSQIEGYYKVNTLLSVFCFARIWYIIKLYLVQSEFYCPRAARLGRLYGADLGIYYALKGNLRNTPFKSFVVLFLGFFIFGFCTIRFFEASVDTITKSNFTNIWNSMWLTLITMTTVGYGDFIPDSLGGRLISILACLAAAFLISLSISTFGQLLEFEGSEKEICNLIERIDLFKIKDVQSKNLVYWYLKAMKKLKQKVRETENTSLLTEEIKETKLKVFMQILEMKSITESINYTYPPQKNVEVFLENFSNIENTLDQLGEKMINLNSKVNEYAHKYQSLLNLNN